MLVRLLLCSTSASAGGVVALGDERVAQYKEAMAAARQVLGGNVPVIEVGAPEASVALARSAPAVVLAVGQKAFDLARGLTPTVPVVVCMVLGASGLQSRTVTGVRLEVTPATQLEQMRQIAPNAKRVGVIYEPKASGLLVEEAVKAAGKLGLTLVAKPVGDARGVRPALLEIAGDIEALLLMPDPRLVTSEMFAFLLSFTLERNIALFGFLDSFTRAGALGSLAPDYAEIGRRAARMALDLAARPEGARIPVPPLVGSPGSLTINMKTARRLRIEVSKAVSARARQVYE